MMLNKKRIFEMASSKTKEVDRETDQIKKK